MNKKITSLTISVLLGATLASCSVNNSKTNAEDVSVTNDSKRNDQKTISAKQVCPGMNGAKTIDMKDMSFSYLKYQDHICATLEVKLDANNEWKTKGSGWFAAGFGAKTMKGSNMFIFVPKTLDPKEIQYSVFSNVGGGGGPTLSLDTKPEDGVIDILSSSLGKVEFALYPGDIASLKSLDSINMIFSHSKASVDKFAPGHIAVYDGYSMDLK